MAAAGGSSRSARLLGYRTYADVSLAKKMAGSPQEVLDFLGDLAARAKPVARRDMDEVRQFAREDLNMAEVRAWDLSYVSEKLRQRRYAYSEQEVKLYFPEDEVLAGMFRVVETIYGVRILRAQAETWHPTVRFYEIAAGRGERIGPFFLGLYPRERKPGGAWVGGAVNRPRHAKRLQTPVA